MDELRELSLFTGYGGTTLGLSLICPVRPVCYVEIDPYCQSIIKARIGDGALPWAPIWDDVATFDGRPWAGQVDIISGGFPCQDISCAGKGAGIKEGTRSGLWHEFHRIICEVRPRYVLVENVAALLTRGMGIVLGALAEAGYDAEWCSVKASDVEAPHRRERVFILGMAQEFQVGAGLCESGTEGERGRRHVDEGSQGRELADDSGVGVEGVWSKGEQVTEVPAGQEVSGRDGMRDQLWPLGYGPAQHKWEPPRLVANPKVSIRNNQTRGQGGKVSHGRSPNQSQQEKTKSVCEKTAGPTQPRLGRGADGRSHRVDRLRALGNGISPQQLAAAVISMLARMER